MHFGKDNVDAFSLPLLLSGMIVVLIILKIFLIFSININWDEFAYLGRAYSFKAGELSSPLQSFGLMFFPWVTDINGTEVDQITAARLLIFIFHLGSVALLTRIAYQFTGTKGALFTTLCYLCFSYTIAHGTSFRHDNIALFFGLAATVVFMLKSTSWTHMIISGALFAIAFAITPKSIIFSVLIIAIFISVNNNRYTFIYRLRFLGAFFLLSACIFSLLISWYSSILNENTQLFIQKISGASSFFIQTGNLNTRMHYFLKTLQNDLIIWVFIVVGFIYSAIRVISPTTTTERMRGIGLSILLLPLSGIILYRNMFPYYYAMFMPILLILAGVAYKWLQYELPGKRSRLALILFPVLIFTSGISHSIARIKDEKMAQKILLENIHTMFRRPVNYIDAYSMVSSFQKNGFFMSTAGMELYNRNNGSIFEKVLNDSQPKFLLANNRTLLSVFEKNSNELPPSRRLLDNDEEVLRNNYIHHWEYVYIAGKVFHLSGENEESFNIHVGGPYTIETEYPVQIDKTLHQPGDFVTLLQDEHIISGTQNNQVVTLRFGRGIFKPTEILTKELFIGF